jgi:hypothetical protein
VYVSNIYSIFKCFLERRNFILEAMTGKFLCGLRQLQLQLKWYEFIVPCNPFSVSVVRTNFRDIYIFVIFLLTLLKRYRWMTISSMGFLQLMKITGVIKNIKVYSY